MFCLIMCILTCKVNKKTGKCSGFYRFFVTLQSKYNFMQEIKNFTDYKLQLMDRILDTVVVAVTTRGIKAVKMDDIAAELGISKRTLYEIYDDKETLVLEGVKYYHKNKKNALNIYAANNHNVLDVVIHFYEVHIKESKNINPLFYEDMVKYPRIMTYLESKRQNSRNDFQQFMKRGVEEGLFRNDIDYTIITHVFEALGNYMRNKHLYQQYTLEELVFNMLFVSLRGVCTLKGIEQLDQFFTTAKR